MKFFRTTLCSLAMAAGVTAGFAQTAPLTIQLEITENAQTGEPSGTLLIKNSGDTPVTVEDPGNRMAMTLVVLNSLGNTVVPTGFAKVNRQKNEIQIPPRSTYEHRLEKLQFLSGSALHGYELMPGENYRAIAIYRAEGEKHPGISSPECLFSVE